MVWTTLLGGGQRVSLKPSAGARMGKTVNKTEGQSIKYNPKGGHKGILTVP